MKNTGFKTKPSSLKRTSGFKKKTSLPVFSSEEKEYRSGILKSYSRMKKFREVKGDELVIQVAEADKLFSIEVRKRDKQCVNCGSSLFLGCSHFFGRGNYATRFDPENCVALCQECHEVWEHKKDGIYKDFMIMWLGEDRFAALEARAKEKISPYQSIKNFMESPYYQPSKDIEY